MPILKSIVGKLFRKKIKKQVYENDHLMYDYGRIYYSGRKLWFNDFTPSYLNFDFYD